MIYITGDCHSDFRRFNMDIFPEQKEMTKEDYVIICGDFGGIWYQENSEGINKENYWLDWLESKSFTTLFVDGNHENFTRLNSFPIQAWHGGKVHKIRSSIIHLMRGEIYKIDGRNIFAFGGASSHDITDGIIEMDEQGEWRKTARTWEKQNKLFRIKDLSWWEEELPSTEEINNGIYNLEQNNGKVDFIISHCTSASVTALIGQGFYEQDRLTGYLEQVRECTEFSKWFCGHYHINQQVDDKHIVLYEQIIRIN